MKRLFYIALSVAALLCGGCKDDEDIFTPQKNAILRYLTSSRRMVAESEVGSVIEENPAFYTQFGQSVYRHIPTYYNSDREEWSQVEAGSTVSIAFNAYVFEGTEPTINDVYWSNIPKTITEVESTSKNRTVRGLAERNAINAPIQGSAADIMKLAMVEIYRRFQLEGIRSKMIMQVHDEVVIDTLNEELDSVKRMVKEAMESVAVLRVPLIAEVNSASNWLDAH